jgi:hypothetical protein
MLTAAVHSIVIDEVDVRDYSIQRQRQSKQQRRRTLLVCNRGATKPAGIHRPRERSS